MEVPIEVRGASNLGALQLELTYDPQLLELQDIRAGPLARNSLNDFNLDTPGRVRIGEIELAAGNGLDDIQKDDAITVCIRPEDVASRGIKPDTANVVPTVVETLEFLGSFYRATLRVQGNGQTTIRADFSINLVRDLGISEGQEFTVALPMDHIRVYGETFAQADDMI